MDDERNGEGKGAPWPGLFADEERIFK